MGIDAVSGGVLSSPSGSPIHAPFDGCSACLTPPPRARGLAASPRWARIHDPETWTMTGVSTSAEPSAGDAFLTDGIVRKRPRADDRGASRSGIPAHHPMPCWFLAQLVAAGKEYLHGDRRQLDASALRDAEQIGCEDYQLRGCAGIMIDIRWLDGFFAWPMEPTNRSRSAWRSAVTAARLRNGPVSS